MNIIKKYNEFINESLTDNILDKISKYGMDSLTDIEKEYIKNIDDDNVRNKLINKKDNIQSKLDYDPRKDKEFWDDVKTDEIDFDFDKFSDDEIEDGKYNIIWDEMEDEEIIIFLNINKITEIDHTTPWDKLNDSIKDKFKKYVSEYTDY